jgi:hypothetical protein
MEIEAKSRLPDLHAFQRLRAARHLAPVYPAHAAPLRSNLKEMR